MSARGPLAAIAAVVVLAGCGSTGVPEAGDADLGREIFTQKCGSCHTLAAAGTTAMVGPNLDAAFARARKDGFDETTIRSVVRNQIEYPSQRVTVEGDVPMPDRRALGLTDEEADAVATFVAQTAAVEGAAPPPAAAPPAAGGSEPAAKSLFVANCGPCHTLADAGTAGTVGPNLDESSIDVAGAERQIAKGGGAMPPFEGQLSDEEIKELAEYVVAARGG